MRKKNNNKTKQNPQTIQAILQKKMPKFPAKSAEDTSWIIHVWFSCVKKRVGAQELRHQGKHQGWMPTSQKLQASETNKMRNKQTSFLKSTENWNQKT